MSKQSPLASWPEFMEAIRVRLERGASEHGERSFTRAPAELCGEVEQELLDVCGWAFILWCRIAAIRSGCPNRESRAMRTEAKSCD